MQRHTECACYFARKQIMTNSYRSCFWMVLALAVGTFVSFSAVSADDAPAGPTLDAPLRVAAKPEKPKAKTYDLRYKLRRGDVLRYEVTNRASFNTTIEQTSQAAQTKTVTYKAWKVTDILPKGNIEFVSVVERVSMINQLPDHDPVEYDSASDKTPPPGFEDVAKTIGVPLIEITMTPRGEIADRQWKVRAPNAGEDSPIALRLPEKPVAIGETWDESFDVPVALENGTSKTVQTRRHHELTKVANNVATIAVTYQVLSPIDPYMEYQLVQRLMEGEVKFDIRAGRVISQQMDIDKRILGFAGPTSSTHYVMRIEERLLKKGEKVATTPSRKSVASKKQPQSNNTKTANRRSTRSSGTIRR
jgi:hypothetical protein